MGYKTTLCDVSLYGGHYGIAAPAVDFKPGLPAYLRITDINDDGTLNPSDRKSVDDSSAGNYLLHEGDIVFARTGNSTGRNYYYDPRDGEYAYKLGRLSLFLQNFFHPGRQRPYGPVF